MPTARSRCRKHDTHIRPLDQCRCGALRGIWRLGEPRRDNILTNSEGYVQPSLAKEAIALYDWGAVRGVGTFYVEVMPFLLSPNGDLQHPVTASAPAGVE